MIQYTNLKSFGRHQNYSKIFMLSYPELEGNMPLDFGLNLDTQAIVLYERKSHDFSKEKIDYWLLQSVYYSR